MHWHIAASLWWLVVPLAVWRVVVRLRRLLSRQRFVRWVQYGRAIGLGLLAAATVVAGFDDRPSLIALAAGLGFGAVLGALGVRFTTFEREDGVLWFQPDRYLGLALALLLLGRIAWRLTVGARLGNDGWELADFLRNRSTMFVFGLFTGHFVVYALGVIYWARRIGPRLAQRAR